MNSRILVTGDYPALESAFFDEIKSIRAKDPFGPLLILVSSKLLRLHLRRFLAENGVNHFNLRLKTLEEFAREVSEPHLLLEGKRETPPHADELLLAHLSKSLAQKKEKFYFREIAEQKGFHRAILETIKDLKDACLSPKDLKRILREHRIEKQVHREKMKDLIHLWEAYEKCLEDLRFYDESDLMASATQGVKDSIILKQTPKVIVYGFYDFNRVQKHLLMACWSEKEAIFFVPYEPTHAFDYVKPTLKWLKENRFQERPSQILEKTNRPPLIDHLCQHLFDRKEPFQDKEEVLKIISAPGESREVREIIRQILKTSLTKGIPLHEIGILLRNPGQYHPLFRENFHLLGIAPYLRDGKPLVETRGGRSLLMLLRILSQNFSRPSVIEFATFSKLRAEWVLSEKGSPITPSQWDDLSLQAGIVEGPKEWEERLSNLRESWAKRGQEEEEEEVRFYRGDPVALDRLIGFIRDLFKHLQALACSNTWEGKTKALLSAFDSFIEEDEESPFLKQAVKRLSELDVCGIPPSQADFTTGVEEVLQEEGIPVGRFQRNGPTVVPLMAGRGVPFKMVILPGMVEKSFPPLIRQDAILLDHERKFINRFFTGLEQEPLPLKKEGRLEEERLLYRLAIGAAREGLILSFPRIEIGTGRERLPSSFLLASVEALTGKTSDFQKIEEYPNFIRVPLSEFAVKVPSEAIDEVEYDLSMVKQKLEEKAPEALAYLQQVSPFFSQGLLLESSRWGKGVFTEFDGAFSSEEAHKVLRDRYSLFKKTVSPTRLESYATCPFQYLLSGIMGIEPLLEPEKEITISPLHKGKLIHSILWKFFTALKKERRTSFHLKSDDLSHLFETARKEFSEYEKMGVTGYPVLWEVEKKEILEELTNFLEEELKETGFIPAYFEVRYGMKSLDPLESEISTEDPIPIELEGMLLYLKGKIDRIDLSKDKKKARVIDYKTGKVRAKENDLGGGKNLQLPLYLYVAGRLLHPLHQRIEVESAEYYFMKSQKRVPFKGSELIAKRAELHHILKTISEGIEEGLFISVPGDHCRICNFEIVCGTSRKTLFERKSKDLRLKRFLEMAGELSEETEE